MNNRQGLSPPLFPFYCFFCIKNGHIFFLAYTHIADVFRIYTVSNVSKNTHLNWITSSWKEDQSIERDDNGRTQIARYKI
jgi:hypothetical protein